MGQTNLYVIGLTGNIACGKSTVLALLEAHGARVIDADRVVHMLQQPGQPVYSEIVAAFGSDILTGPDGPIDRRRLGAIVFADPAALRRLEQIVHPAVHTFIMSWLDDARQMVDRSGVAVIDAIKLLEAGWKEQCQAIWVVTCTAEQQLERLMTTRSMSEAEARGRIAAQPPQSAKQALADVVIDNSSSPDATRQQVDVAWQRIQALQP